MNGPSARRPGALVVLGLVAVLAGAVVLVSPGSRHADFGWFAYDEPPAGYLDGLVVVNGPRALGAGLGILGLALVALALGLGRGARHRGDDQRPWPVGLSVVAGLAVVAGVLGWALPRAYVQVGSGPALLGHPSTGGAAFPTLVWAPGQVAGAGLAVVGVLALVGCLGITLARRRRA